MSDLAVALQSEIKTVKDEIDAVKRTIKRGFQTALDMESAEAKLRSLNTRLHTLEKNLIKTQTAT